MLIFCTDCSIDSPWIRVVIDVFAKKVFGATDILNETFSGVFADYFQHHQVNTPNECKL